MPTVFLPSKPDSPVAYDLIEGDAGSDLLLVFLNGLGLPQAAWKPAIELFLQSDFSPRPRLITYDRYGQGESASDPRASDPAKAEGYPHDLDDVTDDLHELIKFLSPDRSDRIVFVNNSIGAHIARRYANRYPRIVEGILFLDSNPGNVDLFAGVWPNPKAPDFNLEKMMPPGTTLELYETAYNKMNAIFNANTKNKEGFDRRNIKAILPEASEPKLKGSKTSDKGPWITVVGHEVEEFQRQDWQIMKVPIGMAEMYTQPVWEKYNQGLCELTDTDRAKGPLFAPHAGHFVQKDNPSFVFEQLVDLLGKVEGQH